MAVAQVARLHRVVAVVASLVLGERRMRLVHDAGLDRHVVDALDDLVGTRVVGQAVSVLVEVDRRHDLLGGLRHELERALEVVVAVRRLVDLVGDQRVVRPVRRGRVEVPRRVLDHRGEDRVRRFGVVRPRAVVAAGEKSQHAEREAQQRCRPPRTARVPCPIMTVHLAAFLSDVHHCRLNAAALKNNVPPTSSGLWPGHREAAADDKPRHRAGRSGFHRFMLARPTGLEARTQERFTSRSARRGLARRGRPGHRPAA